MRHNSGNILNVFDPNVEPTKEQLDRLMEKVADKVKQRWTACWATLSQEEKERYAADQAQVASEATCLMAQHQRSTGA